MKKTSILLMSILMSIAIYSQENEDTFLQEFLVGNYSVIGKKIGNKDTYFGTMKIEFNNKKFEITRTINRKTIKASGKLEKTLSGEIDVFVINFTENKLLYEITYLIDTDFDNYGRLTGYRYYQNKETDNQGLEALFSIH